MKQAYLLIFLFVSNMGTLMAENIFVNSSLNQEEIEERIVKVENGLLPAIAIQGLPVSTTRLDQPNGLPMEGGYKTYPESAAAGLWSTPIDISKWLVHIQDSLSDDYQNPILNKETLQLMLTHHIAPYGLGPVVNGDGKNVDFSHKGRTDGFACGFVAFPFLGKGVVVMINSDNGSCLVDEIIRGVSEAYEWPSYKTCLRKEIPISKKDLKECPGRYGTGEEKNDIYDVVVSEESGELFIRFGHASIPSTPLFARSRLRSISPISPVECT